jgi:hypothetical protein
MKLIVPADKANHFIGGQAVFAVATPACYLALPSLGLMLSVAVGASIVALVAAGKEAWDWKSGKGTPEVLDFVATVLGAAPLAAALSLAF